MMRNCQIGGKQGDMTTKCNVKFLFLEKKKALMEKFVMFK